MQDRKGFALLAAALLVIQLVCWRGTVRLKHLSSPSPPALVKRASVIDEEPAAGYTTRSSSHSHVTSSTHHTTPTSVSTSTATPSEVPCLPMPFSDSVEAICSHVRLHCPPNGHIDYLQFYYCSGQAAEGDVSPQLKATIAPAAPSRSRRETSTTLSRSTPAPPAPQDKSIPGHIKLLRALALTCIIAWMLFLFSWVGVVASDFFCPNLGTIAARLGLSESTAGVTFLAFGNGSPDVFSTFGAMKSGSGSLAIGELIGAASFIVSVISGSMMLIAPFRVKPYPFLRDVGFFTIAVAMTMAFLLDGQLLFNECLGMIALYVAYASTVIAGSWWQERRRRSKAAGRGTQEGGYGASTPNIADVASSQDMERASSNQLLLPPSPALRGVSPNEYDPNTDPMTAWRAQGPNPDAVQRISPRHSPLLTGYDVPSASTHPTTFNRFRSVTGARHSLLGAVEFRDVVRSLQQEALADRSMEIFQSRDPERFLPHTHSHQRGQHLHPHDTGSPLLQPQSAVTERERKAPGRSQSHRGHLRVKSLAQFRDQSASRRGDNETLRPASGKPQFHRSRSTTGVSAAVEADESEVGVSGASITQRTQPSAMDARALETAIGDPWKEHTESDGMEESLLPPPARPLDDEYTSASYDEEVGGRPRLHIQTMTKNVNSRDAASRSPSQRRKKPGEYHRATSSRRERLIRNASRLVKFLFPSLRHLHEKSWLGIAIGIITAPAILILNLTLPVVDDEAESAALTGEKIMSFTDADFSSGHGKVQLEGPETDLYASTIPQNGQQSTSDEEEGGSILDLGSRNPWQVDQQQQQQQQRQGHLQVASALRHLPQDSSPFISRSPEPESARLDYSMARSPNPLLRTPPSKPRGRQSQEGDEEDGEGGDSASIGSDDSHDENTQASHLFVIVAQCVLAPPFCVWSIASSAEADNVGMKTLVALFAGCGLGLFVSVGIVRQRQRWRISGESSSPAMILALGWARVAVGFLVSILYIMTIVDEVVSILQTLGIILGLSDAILGLTVFAMGNSLGDLVANVTIARMGHPVMAISACFAGPLLNLLLGIGISGTWLLSGNRIDTIPNQPESTWSLINTMTKNHGHNHAAHAGVYHIDFSPTLTVSGVGLLVILTGTLIAVPLNNFQLNRNIGLSLIITYAIIMTVNVLVEIFYLEKTGH